MKNKTKLILFFLLMGFSIVNFAQDTIAPPIVKHQVFANIFTGGYYAFKTQNPNAGFDLSTALIGYKFQKSEKLKFTIIYDVTRTTNGFEVFDTSGNSLPIYYFEGSKYTAYLKMAEIKWQFSKNFSFAAGQLLSERYLTSQDKIWAHRYVLVSMQELFRMGNPADFGMRLEYRKANSFAFTIGANNGDGPFRHQDLEGVIEYTSNLEIYKIKDLLIKTYIALTPATYETENNLKTSFSGFVAYQKKKYTLGAEYSYTHHPLFSKDIYSGVSVFGFYKLTPEWEVFSRFDFVQNSSVVKNGSVVVTGIQYQPEQNLFFSVNYRYWMPTDIQQVYLNVGAKF